MKIVFFGSSRYVIPIVTFLKQNYELVSVITTEKETHHPVVAYCSQENIPTLSVESVRTPEILEKIKSFDATVAVLASFGLIVPQTLLDAFPFGIINVHPSLLPEYRGTTPVQQAILDDKKQTGVSVMQLDSKMDHGPIFGQKKGEIKPDETSVQLYNRLFNASLPILKRVLDHIAQDQPETPQEQDHEKATFTPLLTRESGFIDAANPPSPETLNRMIRAYAPWPGVWTKFTLEQDEKIIKLLPGKKIQVEGKKEVGYKDFINGYARGKEFLEKLMLLE